MKLTIDLEDDVKPVALVVLPLDDEEDVEIVDDDPVITTDAPVSPETEVAPPVADDAPVAAPPADPAPVAPVADAAPDAPPSDAATTAAA